MIDEIAEHQESSWCGMDGQPLCEGCRVGPSDWPCLVRRLADDNARLRAVLVWYADKRNYDERTQVLEPADPRIAPIVFAGSDINADRSRRARDALRAEEET